MEGEKSCLTLTPAEEDPGPPGCGPSPHYPLSIARFSKVKATGFLLGFHYVH